MTETIVSDGPKIAMERVKRYKDGSFKRKGKGKVRIWSGEYQAYWRQSGGYVDDWEVVDPGIFTLEEAYGRTSHCGPEKEIFFEFLPENYRNVRPLARYRDLQEENKRLREVIERAKKACGFKFYHIANAILKEALGEK